MARIKDIVFDAGHAASLARFWAEALDGFEVAPYHEAELARLKELGFEGPEDDPGVIVESTSTPMRLYFQKVPEGKVAKNRVHLDLLADDLEAEVARLEALGARPIFRHGDGGLVAMTDPEGNEFCVTIG